MGLEFWANISTVWLALLCFIGGLIPLAAAYFAVRGMNYALDKSRSAMHSAQNYSGIVRAQTEKYTHKFAEPVIKAEAKVVQTEETIRKLADDLHNDDIKQADINN